MLSQEIVHQDFRSVGDTFASPANGGQEELALLLATQEAEEMRAAIGRVLEHADIEAQDVLTQAYEALVLGQEEGPVQPVSSQKRLQPAELARRGFKAKTEEEELSNLLTTFIEIEEGLLSGLAAKAELRELLDELYDDMEQAL